SSSRFLFLRSSPRLPLFPYTTLFRSVLARPLWALLLLHSWRILGQGQRNAWFAWSIEAGLLLLTTPAAAGLLLLLAVFTVSTAADRKSTRLNSRHVSISYAVFCL